ncbi:phosphoserine phosphatase SerB [Campylobacter mucosalis]|uniref:phosphoserine phosphatase SerB n=1 Tax=Campylobacter mucosalis TaxID=202 RepID=UPI0014706381|nr:phosphoserine phosphatase SerB [Campylobacter mucosalis]
MIKLCVFDFDATLIDSETIDELAIAYGVIDEVREITIKAMAGEFDFYESLQTRVQKLAGMKLEDVVRVCENLKPTNGATELVSGLKQLGIKVVVFSGGFQIATDMFKDKIGYDESFANTLHEKNGVLTGLVNGGLTFSNSKGQMIQRVQNLLGVTPEETMCVGDGANDISMFAHAKISVAFCAKDILKKHATHCIDVRDMREILKIVG